MIVGIGQATRLLKYFEELPKCYTVEILSGKISDTYDNLGKVTETEGVSFPEREELEIALEKFTGVQKQMPPVYSAIKINGKRACDRVRNGEVVTLLPRDIHIYSINLLRWQKGKWTLEIKCSKGTYIRSLAHDLGQTLGCGAIASNIIRTAIGGFKLENAMDVTDVSMDPKMLPPEAALESLAKSVLINSGSRSFVNGERVPERFNYYSEVKIISNVLYQVHDETRGFLGLGFWTAGFLVPKKILVSKDVFKTVLETSQ